MIKRNDLFKDNVTIKQNSGGFLTQFQKLWQLLTLQQKKNVVFLFLLIFVGTIVEMVGMGLVVPLVGAMTKPDFIESFQLFSSFKNYFAGISQKDTVFVLLGAMACIYLFKTVFLVYLAWMQAGFNLKVQASLSKSLFYSYLQRPWLLYKKDNSSSYVQNVNNEVQILVQQGVAAALDLITNILLLIGATILLFVVEPVGTLIIAVSIVIAFLGFQHLSRLRISVWGRIRKEHEVLRLQCLQQGLNSAKEIKLRHCEDFFIDKYHAHSLSLISAGRWQSTLRKFPRYFFELLAVIGLSMAIVYMVMSGKALENIAPIIALFAAIFIKLLPSVNAVLTNIHSIRYIEPTIETIYNELRHRTLNTQGEVSKVSEAFVDKTGVAIDLKHINFSYPGKEKAALDGVNIHIPKGASVGIMGTSGAGKSTLIDLVLGLITPTSGVIEVNNQNINDDLESWQKQIGYVPQSIYLLDDTLRNNIAFAQEEGEIDEKCLSSAIKQAQLERLVENLPDGVSTIIGEDGGQLSGGEKQRIALARALYRNPSVLLLDEATASLDFQTEADVMEAVQCLKGTRTILIVTHRLSAIKDCDIVIQVEKGQIVKIENNSLDSGLLIS